MRSFSTLFLGFVFACSTLFGVVTKTEKMEDVILHLEKGTLLIFDLDNTIIMPAQTVGGEEWFDYLVDKYSKAGDKEAVDHALSEWNAVQRATKSVPVEKNGPELVAKAQKDGVTTLALTARPPELAKATHKALNSIKYFLDANTLLAEPFAFKAEVPSNYEKGVIFVNALNNKGDILLQYLDKVGIEFPSKIVFVDNKAKHVAAVDFKLQEKYGDKFKSGELKYVGCRHAASDDKISRFDSKVADFQHAHFKKTGELLSDDAVRVLLSE